MTTDNTPFELPPRPPLNVEAFEHWLNKAEVELWRAEGRGEKSGLSDVASLAYKLRHMRRATRALMRVQEFVARSSPEDLQRHAPLVKAAGDLGAKGCWQSLAWLRMLTEDVRQMADDLGEPLPTYTQRRGRSLPEATGCEGAPAEPDAPS